MHFIKLREFNSEEMELEAMADSYDSYITLKSESVATKSMISNLNSEDEELNHSMGLHLDGSSPIWSNIGN